MSASVSCCQWGELVPVGDVGGLGVTALGAAAAAHDDVTALLAHRHRAGTIARIRDNAYITLGRTYAQVNVALLAAIIVSQLAEADHQTALSRNGPG